MLRGIDIDIEAGAVTSIVGASGAGKTTLLQVLGTLTAPDSGMVIYDGEEVSAMSDARLSRFRNAHIGFVFQFAARIHPHRKRGYAGADSRSVPARGL